MRKIATIALVIASAVLAAAPANACGATLALIKAVADGDAPPLLRCGASFNAMLHHVGKQQWPEALASYQAHLAAIGGVEAESADAKAVLAYLASKAAD